MSSSKTWVGLVATAAFTLGGTCALAQGARGGAGGPGFGGGPGGGAGAGIQQQDMTHSFDRDQTRDRLHDHDTLHQRDRDRDHDRLLQLSDRIYGSKLMSAQEQTDYQSQLHTMANEQQRVQFRLDQQKQMEARARQQGQTLPRAPSKAQITREEQARQTERSQIYGYSLMSPAEVDQYRKTLRTASSEQERQRLQAEHQQQMQTRAQDRGVKLE